MVLRKEVHAASCGLIFVLTLLLLPSTAFPEGEKRIKTFRCDHPPVIDGTIATDEWRISDSTAVWIQLEPRKGEPASEPTTVYIGYDNVKIYFAFHCFDRQPDGLVADVHERDQLGKGDDAVFILLDTFMDRRSAYGFFVNPRGTQTDIRFGDDGRSQDVNWDAVWEAAATMTEQGWCAEIAIPFSSLSYHASLPHWGINFGRIIRKSSETAYWAGPVNDDFRVSQGGLLTGIVLDIKKSRSSITPYISQRSETGSGEWSTNLDAGLDFSAPVTSGMKLNMTYNPDFATVEGDQEQINLTRWELSFPEKRLFFIEGGELFRTRIRTFYSRRIGDIDYGAKLNGKAGSYQLALIGVGTRPDEIHHKPSSTFSVFRLKRDIFRSSTLGLTAVNKEWRGGHTRSISADYVLNPGRSWKLTGQWVASTPGRIDSHMAWFLRAAHESNNHHLHLRYSDTGEEFMDNVNETGFIRDDDMKEVDSDLIYRWWPRKGALRYMRFSSRNNIFWNHQHRLRSWYITEEIRTYFINRYSVDLSYNNEYKLYEKEFYNHRFGFEAGYNSDEWASKIIGFSWGRNYDRDFRLLSAGWRSKPLPGLSLHYTLNLLSYTPDPSGQTTTINVITVDYNFSRDLYCRILTQNNSADGLYYFYGLFAWRFQPPFGALYLIYTTHEDRFSSALRNRTLFVKVSYQFNIQSSLK